jgi:L-rhamnose mutarotase
MKTYYLALDLKDDPALIAEYQKWHANVWPEIKRSIIDSGITCMKIYRTGNRLFMIIEATDQFSFERKDSTDRENSKVVEWEKLMWNYQQPLPWAKQGEKWMLMEQIFELNARDVDLKTIGSNT